MAFSWTRGYEDKGIEFSQFEDDYYLNTNGHLVKKDIQKDCQAEIDSYFGTRLEAILDMYTGYVEEKQKQNIAFTDEIVDVDTCRNDLDRILAAEAVLDGYRVSDPSNADLDRTELIAKLKTKYKAAVDAYNAHQKGQKDEKNQVEPSREQEEFHQQGDEGS